MDVNAIGLPTNRPLLQSSTRPPEQSDVPGARNYTLSSSDAEKVTAKPALPEGVGAKVDKTV